MKKLLFLLCLMILSVGASAADNQAYLAILAETKLMVIPGMPKMPEGVKMPDVPNMPGRPDRHLDIRLWSPGIAPANATAVVTPPENLKQGKKLNLELYRPKSEKDDTPLPKGSKEFDPEKRKNFTIKIYWGSSATVKEGQPKIIKWGEIAGADKEAMRKKGQEMQAAQNYSSYFYKPNWTTGYWPTKAQPGKIAKDASLVGNYTLNTSYTGNVSIDAPSNVNFLDPISMSSPNLEKSIPLDQAIEFKWKQIANALGLTAWIMGMEGEDTMIIWSSSEVYTDSLMGDQGFMQMADVKKNVEKKIFMKGDRTSVTVPIGIFQKCQMPMFMMSGYGPGAALDKGQPLPRIQTRTSLNIMLGKMQGMPDEEEMTQPDESGDNGNADEDQPAIEEDNSGDDPGEDMPPPAPDLGDIPELNNLKDDIKGGLGNLF